MQMWKSVRADERGEFLESSDWCCASVTSGQTDSLETPECDETAELLQILRVSQTTPAREAFYRYLHTHDVPPKRGRGEK